jgi:hypothetical protein
MGQDPGPWTVPMPETTPSHKPLISRTKEAACFSGSLLISLEANHHGVAESFIRTDFNQV